MTQDEIAKILSGSPEDVVEALKKKNILVPKWEDLEIEYDSSKHPIMNATDFPDNIKDDGTIEKISRITTNFQKLATVETSSLCVGIPVKRAYSTGDNEKQKEAAKVIEKIMNCNRIDDVNIDRCNMLFASCEIFTLWYAAAEEHSLYGLNKACPIKVKCHTYSPMNGDSLYPIMDRYNNMLVMSFGSKEKQGDKEIEYFDVYTSQTHKCYCNEGDGWKEAIEGEAISILKIPGVYNYRTEPIWEKTSNIVYDIEETLSRNSNYLRKNLVPVFGIFADEEIEGDDNKNTSRKVVQYPKGSDARYITWEQAIEGLKFQTTQLRQSFFSQLQLADMSFDSMKSTPMSGEARQMMFIASILKVIQLRGGLKRMLDREINVVKAFVKLIMPGHENEIDALEVENIITPFTIRSAKEEIENLLSANGGKAIMSQRDSIERGGFSDDVDKTLEEIKNGEMADFGEPTN